MVGDIIDVIIMGFGEPFGNQQHAAYSSDRSAFGHERQERLFDVFSMIGIKEVDRNVVGQDPKCNWAFARATRDEDWVEGIDAHLYIRGKGWLRVDVTTDTSKAHEFEELTRHRELDAVIAIPGWRIDLAARGSQKDNKEIIRIIKEVIESI